MNQQLLAGLGLAFVLGACSSSGPNGQQNTGGGGGVVAGKGGGTSSAGRSSTAGAPGSGGSVNTGGGAGGSAAGTPSAGNGGGGGGGAGNGGAGNGGRAAAGTGGVAVGGSSGAASAGTGQTNGGGGVNSGGTGGTAGGAASVGGAGSGGGSTNVTVNLNQAKQTMDGFGINDAWAPDMTDKVADDLFDTTKGIGLSILRIGMGYDGDEISPNCWGDIKKATGRGVTTFIGSVWTAPGDCKSNDDVDDGGHLKTDCYDSWATTIAAFPAKVKQNANVDLYAMSLGNEPDFASCGLNKPCNGNYNTMLYTDTEMLNFVKAAGPKLHAASPNLKVIAPEPSEWIHLWTNQSAPGSTDPLKGSGYDYGHTLAKDATAWSQVDIVGVHQYDTQVAEPWPSDVPPKTIWQTEMSGVKWWPEEGPTSDINNAVVVASWIHDAIVNGPASAWIWWWYHAGSASNQNDNEGLLLQNDTVAMRYYTLGNYSKFIRPGYTRVNVTGNVAADVLLTGYKGADGTVVVVAVNKGAADATVPITIAGGTAPAMLTPWVTSASDKLVNKAAVMVTSGSFTAALPSKSVTTFVGK